MNVTGFFIISSVPAHLKLWFKKVHLSLSNQKYKQGCQTTFKLTQAVTINNDVNTQQNHFHSRGMETTAHWGALNSYYLPNNFRITKLQMHIEATGVPYMKKYNKHSKLLGESLKGREHLGTPVPHVQQHSLVRQSSLQCCGTCQSPVFPLWAAYKSGKMTEKMRSSPTVTCHNYKLC